MQIKRISGTTLRNIRRAYFARYPLCAMCLSKTPQRTTVATELDHIKPLHKGGTDTPDNRQGLCRDCHQRKSKTERGHEYKPKAKIGLDGFPLSNQ